MKKLLAIMLVLALVLAGCGGGGGGETADGKVDISFGTGGTSGTYYAFGGVLAGVLSEAVEGVNISVQSTGASKANIQLICDGEAQMALVQNDTMDYAYRGTDLFADEGALKGFMTMGGIYAEVCQIVTSDKITSIDQLKGKVVSVGDAGSGVEFNARQILEAYGISFDDIKIANLGFGESANAFKDGKIDAFFVTAGAPTTALVDLATTNTINVLEIDDEHAKALMEKYPFYTQYVVPSGSYKGVDSDKKTVAVKATVIVSEKLPEDVVYNLTKAMFDKKAEIAAGHAKGENLDPKYAVEGMSVPFHPGAEKYYKEVGVLK